jgi:ferrochelatase
MKTGVLVVNFGEPESASLEEVVPFLERIFLSNAGLEAGKPPEAALLRSRQLAEARAPALVAEYRAIGGSPLNAQARAQAAAVQSQLRARRHDVVCYPVFQFLEPSARAGVERARQDGCQRLVALPVYPLCGQTTTVAALEEVARAVHALDWSVDLLEIAGWHGHPDFVPLQSDHVADHCGLIGVDLHDPETRLFFSIHGTPLRYLEAGNRYDRYVDETCAGIARRLGVERYTIGFQNHTNRPIEWTQPSVEEVLARVAARRLVVVTPSFMHEQSETLAELDIELRKHVEARGMSYRRVPIPHDHPRFVTILADLVEGLISTAEDGAVEWRRCLCRPGGRTRCTNGLREDSAAIPASAPRR